MKCNKNDENQMRNTKRNVQQNTWWRHQMETFSALLAICAGNSPVPVNSPHKGQWRGALMFSLICTSIKGWVNNREAGELRRHSAHYDVIVMLSTNIMIFYWYYYICTVVSLISEIMWLVGKLFIVKRPSVSCWNSWGPPLLLTWTNFNPRMD